MNNTRRTLYSVLGVAPEAPDAVIKAAYRALAKQYHPDSSGSEQSSEFLELQSAYEILSDPNLRAAYDQQIGLQEDEDRFQDASEDETAPIDPDETWALRRELHPNIDSIYSNLARYSLPLANHFRLGVIDGDFGNDPELYADGLEAAYFNKYFGSDPRVQALARSLLVRNLREAAKELNIAQKRGILSDEQRLRQFIAELKSRYGLRQDGPRGSPTADKPKRQPKLDGLRGVLILASASVAVFAALVLFLQGNRATTPIAEPKVISNEPPASNGKTSLSPEIENPPPVVIAPSPAPAAGKVKKTEDRLPPADLGGDEELATPEVTPPPPLPIPGAEKDTRPLPAQSIKQFVDRMRRCWVIPAGAQEANVIVKMQIELNQDGSLASIPRVLNGPGDELFKATAQSAITAIKACQKYSYFPADQYDTWRDLVLNFSPRMFQSSE